MEKLVGEGVVAAKVSSLQLTLLRGEEWTTKNWAHGNEGSKNLKKDLKDLSKVERGRPKADRAKRL